MKYGFETRLDDIYKFTIKSSHKLIQIFVKFCCRFKFFTLDGQYMKPADRLGLGPSTFFGLGKALGSRRGPKSGVRLENNARGDGGYVRDVAHEYRDIFHISNRGGNLRITSTSQVSQAIKYGFYS